MTNFLGLLESKQEASRLRASSYINGSILPTAPPIWDPTTKQTNNWYPLGNTLTGDCTCAAILHQIMLWRLLNGQNVSFTDQDGMGLYEILTGWTPQEGGEGPGVVETVLLSYMQKTGYEGHQIGAYLQGAGYYQYWDHALLQQCIWLFGGVQVGIYLPWQTSSMGQTWDIPEGQATTGPWAPNSWGGHEILICSYDSVAETYKGISWGLVVTITKRYWDTYMSQCEVLVSQDYLNGNQVAPNGFNVSQLNYDLAHMNDPPPPPTPQPPQPAPGETHQMFTPPVALNGPIAAVLKDPDTTDGFWLVTPAGSVYSFLGAAYHGSPASTDKVAWGNRTAADIVLPNAAEKAAGKHYTVVDTAVPPERYSY